jgi:hypothetical protein
VVYAVSAYGLLRKAKWALPTIIAVSVVDRALALVIFDMNFGFALWTTWKIVIVTLAFYIARKK